MTTLPPPIFPNLPTLPKVKNTGVPTDGLSSTAIAIAITMALTCQIIQRLHKNFSVKSNVCTVLYTNTQAARKTTHSYSKWRHKLSIFKKIITLIFTFTSLATYIRRYFNSPHKSHLHQRVPWRSAFINTPENAEMHQRVPWRQPFIDERTYNNIHPPCWDGYKLMVKLDLTVSSESEVLHSGGTASFS